MSYEDLGWEAPMGMVPDVAPMWLRCGGSVCMKKNIVYIFNPSCQVPPGGCNFHLLLGYVLLAFANYKNMY